MRRIDRLQLALARRIAAQRDSRRRTEWMMAVGADDVEQRDTNLERLVFFSDGVFAIAITLLVIDLRVPDVPAADLQDAVWNLGPSFFSYVLSFLVIGIYWMAHRRIFSVIVRGDGILTWLNMVYLMLIAFLPFPTAMRGAYDGSRFSLVFYAAVHVAIGIVSLSMWLYATRGRRLTRPDLPEKAVASGLVNGTVPTAIFLLSIGVAFVDVELATLTWIGLAFSGMIRKAIVGR